MPTVVIAGGSGFIGRKLHAHLEKAGWRVVILTRRPRQGRPNDVEWLPDGGTGPWATHLNGCHAVVNLAGENIGTKRWSEARKRALRESRINSTRSLAAAVLSCSQPPAVFLSASGMNYYAASDAPVTEATPPGNDDFARLCVDWEREASFVAGGGNTRLVILRNGLVLSPDGGALRELMLPIKFGVGGVLGSGQQYMPWIHIDDWIALATWLMDNGAAQGAFNVTSPNPVTNQELTRTLARVMRRPAVFRVPGFALRLIVGEVAEYLLTGPRMVPARAQEMGFRFRFPEVEPAMRDLLKA